MKVKQIKTSIPGWYDTEWLEANGVAPEAGAYIRSRVPVTSKKISSQLREEEDRLRREYATNDLRLFVIPKLEQSKGSGIELSGQTDSENVDQYLATALPEAARFTVQAAATYMVNLLTKIAPGRSGSAIRFLYTEAENILSFKKVKIPYRNRGFVLLKGENLDWGPGVSIGSGKTGLLSLLTVGLIGRTPKGQANDEWARENVEDRAIVRHVLRDSRGRKAEIERQRRPHHITLWVDGKDQSQGITGKGKTQTQGLIEELTGFDMRMLMNSVYIDQTVANAFVFGEQKDRLDLVNRLCSLERFEIALKQVAKDRETNEKEVKEYMELVARLESEISICVDQLDDLTSAKAEHWAGQLKEAEEAVRFSQEAYSSLLSSEAYYQEQQDVLADLVADGKSIQVKLNEAAADIKYHEAEKQRVEKLVKVGKCSQCGQTTKNLHFKTGEVLAIHKKNKQRFEESAEKLLLKMEKVKAKIDRYKDHVTTAKQELDESRRHLATIEEGVKEEAERNQKLDMKRKELNEQLRTQRKLVASLTHQLRELDIERELMEFVSKAFHRTGMPMYLSAGLCPVLNKAAEEYSELFTDGKVKIVFEVVDGEFKPRIVNSAGSKTRKGQSKGESAWAGCIAAFALRETAPKTNLLILDEPGHGLDQAAQKQFAKGLLKLKDRFETIIVCTHSPVIESILSGETIWTVRKQNGVSRLYM